MDLGDEVTPSESDAEVQRMNIGGRLVDIQVVRNETGTETSQSEFVEEQYSREQSVPKNYQVRQNRI